MSHIYGCNIYILLKIIIKHLPYCIVQNTTLWTLQPNFANDTFKRINKKSKRKPHYGKFPNSAKKQNYNLDGNKMSTWKIVVIRKN